jgi:uncharacterized membrane protein
MFRDGRSGQDVGKVVAYVETPIRIDRMNPKPISERSFFVVSALGALFVLLETLLQAYGTSICGGVGCKLVAKYTRFGDLSILLIGLGTFTLLGLLSYLTLYRSRHDLSRFIDLVLIAALAGEGFFTGYQAFRLHAACVFCLTVFAFLVVLGLLRLFAGHKEALAGFGAMATVFVLFYLVLPADSSVSLPGGRQAVLFTSTSCRHCAELLKELDERKLAVEHVLADDYAGVLKSVGVDGVPTLYVNNGKEKLFLTGKQAVLEYLLDQKRAPKSNTQPADRQGQNLLKGAGNGFEIILPQEEDGACKQDDSCK